MDKHLVQALAFCNMPSSALLVKLDKDNLWTKYPKVKQENYLEGLKQTQPESHRETTQISAKYHTQSQLEGGSISP